MMIASLCLSPLAIADENDDIPTNAQNTGYHDSLVAALSHADLVSTLQGDGPFTVFAPTDSAFLAAGIDLSTFDTDEENETLVDILTYHVYSGSVSSSQVTDGMSATMLNGDDVTFTVAENGDIQVGGANVTTADVISSNGVIHVIDKVLLPPPEVTEEDGDICYNTVTHTVAAGASFEECTAYTYYEDADFGGQTFTGCYNMVTHVADATVSQEVCEAYVWTPALDIPTTAQATTIHNSLVAALTQAQLVATLQGDGPFTVFAPTDNAFLNAGIDLSTFDTDEENETLVDILTYHVVPSQVPSSAVTDGLVATAVNGDDLTFTVSDSGVMVNDALVTLADVPASNGVIHVIDKVLLPPPEVTEEDGDICYNTVTHTIVAGASFEECTAYAYYDNVEFGGQTFTGCYNMVTHAADPTVSQEICEAYLWTPAVDIPTTAQATTIHNSLVAALTQAQLVATLQGDGPFTVFAPTDNAFLEAGIDLSTFDTDEEIATLVDILTYHVVPSQVPSSAVTDGLVATAVNGDDLTFTVSDSGVMVNDANVTLADVPASNGVIHVIDKVLLPPPEVVDTSDCSVIIGIDSTGLAFDQTDVSINVGDTVCWIWEDESMAHNVAETTEAGDDVRKSGGIYSGQAETTVDFRYTFTEDTTFFYICEPHATMDMRGKITVGEGSVVEEPDPIREPEASTVPGFGSALVIISLLGALIVFRNAPRES
ncbi:MAG: fasciclin domain-containing protein [Candidatus Thermoplasmatota archaeon]|nr:fasciclin domain-containing protein [Candidatus Thermoplasmatota archaeon]MEC7391050.1 fasciclin domain-containing protein [Candidatus Thermoplasmatota archaeon]